MRRFVPAAVAVPILVVALLISGRAFQTADRLPAELADEAYWTLITTLSESGGMFSSQNFVSNERSYQRALDVLAKGRQPASAYIGVGPEQNFTYILALKPQVAFVIDIRRQNLVQHLMYKAIFEISGDRADFLSRLFSRPRPDKLSRTSSVVALFDAFAAVQPDFQRFQNTLEAVRTCLITTHRFALTTADEAALEGILRAFAVGGPDLTYAGPKPPGGSIYPTFEEIMKETDGDGIHRGFLATEDNYLAIKAFQKKNLLIPIVGDFAGPSALKLVGEYIRSRKGTVTAFYTSNVEQYLFQSPAWRGFYANVATLPVTTSSVFIRGVIRASTGEYSASPMLPPTSRYETRLFSIPNLASAFGSGAVQTYHDILIN
jgi:hypothetical protein